jgi:hypothetical protein
LEKRARSRLPGRPIAVSIMLPLSGAGFKAITTRDKRRLSVVDSMRTASAGRWTGRIRSC